METTNCFKICRRGPDGKFTSFNSPSVLTKTYEIGEWTEADIGGLFVFINLYDALKPFITNWFSRDRVNISLEKYTIFVAKAEIPIGLPKTYLGGRQLSDYEKYWAGPSHTPGTGVYCWPIGTSVFKRVKLIRELTKEELLKDRKSTLCLP